LSDIQYIPQSCKKTMYVNYTTPMQSKKKKGLMLCYINLSLDEKLE